MATIQYSVPINGSREARENWVKECTTDLDAGNDVEFIDESGTPCNVPFVGLMSGTDGALKSKTVSGDTTVQSLASAGFHQIRVNKIFADGTDSSLGICVKLA